MLKEQEFHLRTVKKKPNNSYTYSNEIQSHLKCCCQEMQSPRASGNPGADCRLFLGSE